MTTERENEIVYDFWLTRFAKADHFTAMLFRLLMKADGHNRDRLSLAYPLHVDILRKWESASSEEEFFDAYGLPKKEEPNEGGSNEE